MWPYASCSKEWAGFAWFYLTENAPSPVLTEVLSPTVEETKAQGEQGLIFLQKTTHMLHMRQQVCHRDATVCLDA